MTAKVHTGDVDASYDPIRVDRSVLHPALLDMSPGRPAQKAAFGCEFFPNIIEGSSGRYFVEFFQRDRDGRPKGVVVIDLTNEGSNNDQNERQYKITRSKADEVQVAISELEQAPLPEGCLPRCASCRCRRSADVGRLRG
ncbi:MAG: hypothetical protein IPG03_17525 [Candidatus Microthrix sp.]|nr:hypothetical protein [Candidatus Microthrix sp.]MBK6504078.1 hypothetical protein [Candidatus Microthrix sp.]